MRTSYWLPIAIFALVLSFAVMWWANRPVDVGPGYQRGDIQSLSFAPYRQGYSPLVGKFPPDSFIEEDLRLLAGEVRQVRTYASGEGLEKTHALAAELGLTYLQGAWLTHNSSREGRASNQLEVKRLIKAANGYPGVVKRVVVGNEVLLRGDMPVNELITYIKQVKAAVKQPVTYADVWSMYLKYPELIEAVDFITIHVLPYWEDEPIPADKAAAHLAAIVAEVRKQADSIAPGKAIYIGETGWPSHGRQRGLALPSVENQALYIRQVVRMADSMGLEYNLVEAFNQPWKAQLEGVVGAYWGLWDADRAPVSPNGGPVQANPNWLAQWLMGVALWAFMVFVALRADKAPEEEGGPAEGFDSLLYALATVGGALFVAQTWGAYAWWEWSVAFDDAHQRTALGLAGVGAILCLLAVRAVNGRVANYCLAGLLGIYLLFASWHTLQLAWAGRYLSFPNWQLGLVLCVYAWLALRHSFRHGRLRFGIAEVLNIHTPKVLWLGGLLCLSGVAMFIGETRAFYVARDLVQVHADPWVRLQISLGYVFNNGQLMTWLAMLFVVGVLLLGGRYANVRLASRVRV